jgi:hypothetical protein
MQPLNLKCNLLVFTKFAFSNGSTCAAYAEGAATISSSRRLPQGGIWATNCLLDEGFDGAEAIKGNASGILMAGLCKSNPLDP